MNKRKQIQDEVDRLPDGALDELLEFVRAVKRKGVDERHTTTQVSEKALARDWLLPEEDAAWYDL